jgi:hypothetical protein
MRLCKQSKIGLASDLYLWRAVVSYLEIPHEREKDFYKRASITGTPNWKITTKAAAAPRWSFFIFAPCRFHLRSHVMLPHSCGLIGIHLGQSLFCC